jgi:hypothetical protein
MQVSNYKISVTYGQADYIVKNELQNDYKMALKEEDAELSNAILRVLKYYMSMSEFNCYIKTLEKQESSGASKDA